MRTHFDVDEDNFIPYQLDEQAKKEQTKLLQNYDQARKTELNFDPKELKSYKKELQELRIKNQKLVNCNFRYFFFFTWIFFTILALFLFGGVKINRGVSNEHTCRNTGGLSGHVR